MSGYLTDMAQVLLQAGLTIIEYDGWKTRARSTGGFNYPRPFCVMWHHTASRAKPENDAAFMCRFSDARPIANLMIDRTGVVWVLAAGATNTNGTGRTLTFSRGTVPVNSMNTHAIGVEICNDGRGEQYPEPQVDAMFTANNALAAAYDMEPTDLSTHNLYAPERKIDPAQALAVQGRWKPSSSTKAGTWNTTDIRTEANRRAVVLPPPPVFEPGPPAPPLTKDDTSMVVALDSNGTAWVGDGMTRMPITNEAVFNNMVMLGKSGCYRFVNTSGQVVSGWPNVNTVGQDTIEALGVYG